LERDHQIGLLAINLTEIELILKVGSLSDMVNGHVVLAGCHPWQQVGVIGGDERGAYVHFLCQQFTQFHFKTGEFVAVLEVERWRIGFKGDAQFATIEHIIDQFGVSQGAQKGKQQ